jgi:hypothetical protein
VDEVVAGTPFTTATIAVIIHTYGSLLDLWTESCSEEHNTIATDHHSLAISCYQPGSIWNRHSPSAHV